MFSDVAAEATLGVPVRALEAVRGDKINARFLVGSCVVVGGSNDNDGGDGMEGDTHNDVYVVRYQSDLNQLSVEARLSHPTGPVQKICASPTDPNVFLTLAEGARFATLWRMPPIEEQSEADGDYSTYDELDDVSILATSLQRVATLTPSEDLPQSQGGDYDDTLVDMAWRGGNEWEDAGDTYGGSGGGMTASTSSVLGDVVLLDRSGRLTQYDVSLGAEATRSISVGNALDDQVDLKLCPPKLAWDPHNVETTAVSMGRSIYLLDWRVGSDGGSACVGGAKNCHRYGITDMDFNPNKPYVLATSGQDGLVKFWDVRRWSTASTSLMSSSASAASVLRRPTPLLTARGGHRHWATQVRYNPNHDQLLVSAGTDAVANLWRMSTISSAPLLAFDDSESPNARIERHEHTNSVAWGVTDVWTYLTTTMTMSTPSGNAVVEGKIALRQVPSNEKYKILL